MFNFQEGEVLLVDKPYKWTSFDVVKKLRGAGKIKKIGHAGTLDPLATGLLILCTGKKTKQIDKYQGWEKEYEGRMLLGKTTPSVDLETEFDQEFSLEGITQERIQAAILPFLGTITQTPPLHSAVKINGERAYKKARRGETVKVKEREVFIRKFQITSIEIPYVSFKLVCSKGTYVRSLVRDFGESLNIGACLVDLRRTRIGTMAVSEAKSPAEFVEVIKEKHEGSQGDR